MDKTTYYFRAGLEWNLEYYDENCPKIPSGLPVNFGPFHLALSPNATYYCAQKGWLQDHPFPSLDEPPPDQNYPNSILYAETEIKAKGDKDDEETLADERFEQLEALLRVFASGDIYLRRNLTLGIPSPSDDNESLWVAYIYSRPIKPIPNVPYARAPYMLDEAFFSKFQYFFNNTWDFIVGKNQPICNALYRFSSSYERRKLADRLIELMISMEALFGDKDYQRYKIPLRFACLLYNAGKERKEAFDFIKGFYDERSSIVHGGKFDLPPEKLIQIDKFEDCNRQAIIKFLELLRNGHDLTTGSKIDKFLFFSD